MSETWRACSSCKAAIGYSDLYWVCNVSTCNRKRTGLVFCSVSCWDAHVPVMRHREAWARERHAPTRAEAERAARQASEATQENQRSTPGPASPPAAERGSPGQPREPRRTLVRKAGGERREASGGGASATPDLPREILIVASRLKAYINARSGMNTSEGLLAKLSDHVRALADEAIGSARRAERKTVMDRDLGDP